MQRDEKTQLQDVIDKLIKKAETDLQKIRQDKERLQDLFVGKEASTELQTEYAALSSRLGDILSLINNIRRKNSALSIIIQNQLLALEKHVNELRSLVHERLVLKAEMDYASLCDGILKAFERLNEEQPDTDALTKPTEFPSDIRSLIAYLDIAGKYLSAMTPDLQSRLFKMEVKALMIIIRQEKSKHFGQKPNFNDEAKLAIDRLLTRFNQYASTLMLRDDEKCQRTLYNLYEIKRSIITHEQKNNLASFFPFNYLLALSNQCPPSLTKLMAMQSYMHEQLLLMYKINETVQQNHLIEHRPDFIKAYKEYIKAPDYLGNVSLAKAHFAAYRYCLAGSYYLLCGDNHLDLCFSLTQGGFELGEWDEMLILPQFPNEVTTKALTAFMVAETELRETYYEPCLTLLESFDYECLPDALELQLLLKSIVGDGLAHSYGMSTHFNELLEAQRQGKITLSPQCVKKLKDYCQTLIRLNQRWMWVYEDYAEQNVHQLFGSTPVSSELHKISKDAGQYVAKQTAEALQKQETKEAKDEKKSQTARKQAEDMANAEHKRVKKAKETQLISLMAQHEARVEAQRKRYEQDKKEREAADHKSEEKTEKVVVVAEVKSNFLMVLEMYDKKIDSLGSQLFGRVQYLDEVLNMKLSMNVYLNDEDLKRFPSILRQSIQEYNDLFELNLQYRALSQQAILPAHEKRFRLGIAVSINYACRLQSDIRDLLLASAATLKIITEQATHEREKFIRSLGRRVAKESDKDVASLTDKQIFELGLEKFKQLGRKSGGPSEATMERRFFMACLKEFYDLLQTLQPPPTQIENPAVITHDPRLFGGTAEPAASPAATIAQISRPEMT